MNSIEKKELISALKDIQTSRKIKDKHINYLLQAISNLKLTEKIIKEVKWWLLKKETNTEREE